LAITILATVGDKKFGVLPTVGPGKVGKTTFVFAVIKGG